MRLPARIAVPCLFVLSLGVALGQAPPKVELQGGALAQPPPQITRIDAATAPQTTEAGPQPFGYESEVHCFGYIGDPNERFLSEVIGAENSSEQTDFTTNDLLYMNGGADRGIKPGDEFWIITPGDEVIHPVTGRDMGRFYQQRGRATVVCIEGRTATARVNSSCTEIPMGSFLKPYEPVPIPLGRRLPACASCDPPSGKIQGSIVYSRDGVVAVGADADVLIDLGVAEGVQPGDQFSIFRYASGTQYGVRPQGSYWVNTASPEGVEVPRTYLGDLAVLYVGDRWAMGRVIDSKKLIGIGDQVELK
jgi:hypothetical protein